MVEAVGHSADEPADRAFSAASPGCGTGTMGSCTCRPPDRNRDAGPARGAARRRIVLRLARLQLLSIANPSIVPPTSHVLPVRCSWLWTISGPTSHHRANVTLPRRSRIRFPAQAFTRSASGIVGFRSATTTLARRLRPRCFGRTARRPACRWPRRRQRAAWSRLCRLLGRQA